MPSINSILIKRNNVSGAEPNVSDLTLGELALNSADGKLFVRTETPNLTSVSSFLNSKELPYTLNESFSSINTQHGGNTVSQVFGAVLGGYNNDNSGAGSTIINGENNDVNGDFSTILNGLDNKIESTGDYSAILGGKNNLIFHENSFTIGSNLSSHANNFTYVNNISAQGVMYGDGSGLINLAAAAAPDTVVRSLTSNWESTYLTVSALSSTWASSTGDYLPLSGGQLTGTLIGNVSATGYFYGDGSKLTGIVAGDTVATTLVRSNSGYWQDAYTTVNSTSSNWVLTTDSRLSDSRNPNGNANGDLSGTYPNPTIKNSVILTGVPEAPTAPAGTYTKQIANTEFVIDNAGDRYLTTSNTSNVVDNSNNKTFTVASSSLAYTPTQDVTIVSQSDPLNIHMHCTVVSYSGYTLVVNSNSHSGNGTHSDWVINVGGYTVQSGVLLQSNNLSDISNAYAALTNLGGVSATRTIATGTGLTGGGNLTTDRTISIVFGNTSNTAVSGNDPRLSDSRTPTVHKTTHAIGGSDVLTPSDIGAVSNSTLSSLSGNWQSSYTTVQSNSALWNTIAASASSTNVQILTSSGTWVKPAGAKSVDVLCIGGGGGGGSGRVAGGTSGGGAGAGGGYSTRQIPASILSSIEIVSVGAGGTGGAPVSAVNASGNNGVSGGDSSFGTLPWVFAGGGGGGGGSQGGAAGGPNARTINIGGYAGGGGTAALGGAASSGSTTGAGGGGGGGGYNVSSAQWYGGGNGFPSFASATIGGQSQGGLTQGAAGTSGHTLNSIIHAGGGGAGGASSAIGNAGAGGNGGLYGGGGGGGGCQGLYPGTGGVTYSSGAGGNGAQGIVIITTYF